MSHTSNRESSDRDTMTIPPEQIRDTLRKIDVHLLEALDLMGESPEPALKNNRFRMVLEAREYVFTGLGAQGFHAIEQCARNAYKELDECHDEIVSAFPSAYGEVRQAMDKLHAVISASREADRNQSQ